MKRIIPITVAALLAAPLQAQTPEPPAEDEGFSLMQRGAELFFEGILGEMEPAIEDFRAFAEMAEPHLRALLSEMGPALMQVLDRIDDIANYEAPEILDNGDIIIRRKPEAPDFAPDPEAPEIDI
ncbi:hypothetical protein FHS00_001721 [Limimaricola variabilis]|uniref:AAA+ family ATPase n=1 Tax=Limimaricola variabilis TaxID=1492771 RepID=A0ABR6HNL2_9RHOB|nr:hypothetical protein [Limimaricola variabilis]MBB3712144.1 hypothetical protein [Limimaricola variabilis]WPY93031.1 hypothetical protein T8T21_07800 [Limimaricola variabilis]